ncbi:MAG: ABC transporter substrate-binding protein [Nocardioidaceae bacterium]
MVGQVSRRHFLAGVGSAGLLVAVGCSSPTSTSSRAGSSTPKRGGTLIIAQPSDIPELDPANQSDFGQLQMYQAPLRRLAGFGQHEPDLASSVDVSADGLVYTVGFRPGITFHDGTAFDARSWVFAMQRQAFPDNPYHTGPFGHYVSLTGGFPGKVKSIEADDATTARMTLNEPIADLEFALADIEFAAAINPAVIKKDVHFGQQPVGAGTGPFRFVERVANDHVTLERYDGYWRKGFPYLDRVILKVIPDSGARVLALKAGEIQMMNVVGPEIDQLKDDPRVQLHSFPPYFANYISFDSADPVVGDPKVREAICRGIDRGTIAKQFSFADEYKSFGSLPGLPGYRDDLSWYPYDPNAAKQLLASVGHPGGIDVALTFANGIPLGADPQLMSQALQGQLAQVGIRVKLNQIDPATLYQSSFGPPGRKDYPYQMALSLFGSDGDEFGLMQSWTSAANYAGYHPKYLQEFNKAATEPSAQARVATYKSLQQIMYDDVAFVPLVYTPVVQATAANVQNLVPYYLETTWLS